MPHFNVRVEYERTPIRHIAVQCPQCDSWFYGREIVDEGDPLLFENDVYSATFTCPICRLGFGHSEDDYYLKCFSDTSDEAWEADIKEVSYPDVYEGVKSKKVSWE